MNGHYFITATSERGKPVTKYGAERILIDVEYDRRPAALISISRGYIIMNAIKEDGRAGPLHVEKLIKEKTEGETGKK